MPQFPEKESSLLAKLKKSKPHSEEGAEAQQSEKKHRPSAVMSSQKSTVFLYSILINFFHILKITGYLINFWSGQTCGLRRKSHSINDKRS